ncbi:MAG TPA: S8 family serine peptidase [Nitrospiria bacterium]
MKRTIFFGFLLGLLILPGPAVSKERAPENAGFVPGEILVGLKEGVSDATGDDIHRGMGSQRIRSMKNSGVHHIRIKDTLSVREAVSLYEEDPNILFAEPNYIRRAFAVPNDPFFTSQWGMDNTGQVIPLSATEALVGLPDADVDAPEAWDLVNVASPPVDVVIALMDSGIDFGHPDLDDNLWTNPIELPNGLDDDGNGRVDDIQGWDFVGTQSCNRNCTTCSPEDPIGDNDPLDDHGHGTLVGGVAAAEGDNGIGVTGILWNASIMPLKVLDSNGCGSVSDEVEAIDFAIEQLERMQAQAGKPTRMVINASFGAPGQSFAEEAAIRRAGSAGIVFVAAAGNSGDNNDQFPIYPASHNLGNVISVASSNHNDRLSFFSHFGKNNVDLTAPGERILSTAPSWFSCFSTIAQPAAGYCFESGTSFAAPFVSGAAGLLMIQNKEISPEEVRSILILSAEPKQNLNGIVGSSGRLSLYNALTRKEGTALSGGDGGCGASFLTAGGGAPPPGPPGQAGFLLASVLWILLVRPLRKTAGFFCQRPRPAAGVLFLMVFSLVVFPAPSAEAQLLPKKPGRGFSPYHLISLKTGHHRFHDSDFFENNGGLVSKSDLASAPLELEYERRIGKTLGIAGTLGRYSKKADLITVCCADISVSTVYLLGSGKYYPDLGGIGFLEFYIGGGGGLYIYRQELGGFLSHDLSGSTVGLHLLAGIRIPVHQRFALFSEFRYALAKIESADRFDNEIDVGGINYLFGISWVLPEWGG